MPGENQLSMDFQAVCLQQGKIDGTSQQQTKVFLLELPSETKLIFPETLPYDDFASNTEHNGSIQSVTNLFVFDSSSSQAFPLYISSSFYTTHSSTMDFPIIPMITENTTYPNSNPAGEITNPDYICTISPSDVTSFSSQNIVIHEEKSNMRFAVSPAEASPSFYDQSLIKCSRQESDDESMFSIFSEEENNAHQNIDSPAHYTEPFDMSLLLNQNLRTETPMPSLIPIQESESLQEMPFTTNLIRENALSSDMFPKPCPTLMPMKGYDTRIAALTPEAILLFSEQMRKHVQLLTQMHLITAQQSALISVTEECRSMLEDLLPLKQNLEIANLDEALDLVTYWETNVTKTSPETLFKFERTVVTSGERKKFVKRSSKHPNRYPFNPQMVKLMAESRVFIYPELLPTLAIFQSEPGPCKMSIHEEQLIAMGMEQFTPYCTELLKDDAKVSSKENFVYSMISRYMLPHWTSKQIATRVKNKSFNNQRTKNEWNPIKYYRKNKVAPPLHHVVQPFDRYTTKRLCDVPISLLPERWQELFLKPSAAGKRPLDSIAPYQERQTSTTTAGIHHQDEAQPIVKRRRVLGELIN